MDGESGVSRQTIVGLLVLALLGGGWFFFRQFEVAGLDALTVRPRGNASGGADADLTAMLDDPAAPQGAIRIAAFNIQVLGQSKMDKPEVVATLVRICRTFDVVAIQEIRSKEQNVLPRLVAKLNAEGRQYDFVIGPRLGRTSSKEQYAFLFDTATVEVDRYQSYTVADPADALHREPLVGWFRVRGPPADQAFTFSLVNVHTDPDEVAEEVDALAAVFRSVRDDGRGEDDVIMLGDFNASDEKLGRLGQIGGLQAAISGTPTNVRRTEQYDNLLFTSLATVEYTGRGGVFDFLRQYNLTQEQALEVSDHLPVWAEFSALEGGAGAVLATRPGDAPR